MTKSITSHNLTGCWTMMTPALDTLIGNTLDTLKEKVSALFARFTSYIKEKINSRSNSAGPKQEELDLDDFPITSVQTDIREETLSIQEQRDLLEQDPEYLAAWGLTGAGSKDNVANMIKFKIEFGMKLNGIQEAFKTLNPHYF